MTREERINLLNELLEIEEKNDIGNLTREERGEFQQWVESLEQEPFINKPCVSSGVCEHDKNVVIDKIRAEIDKARFIDKDTKYYKNALASGLEVAMKIIDKYKAESEG